MIQTLDNAPIPFRGTEIHTLPNGLQLILKEDHTVPVVAMQVWARCGAIDESPDIYGISHGLEHMVFKGTPTRSAGQISRSIESFGGSINAATQLETTHYYIDIPSYGANKALEVLADTIANPTFPEDELKRERLVILEEIHRRDDSPDATLWDEFSSRVFKGTPYDIKVIGNEKTVSNMSQADLKKYYSDHYVPEKMKVVVVGDFKKNILLKQLYQLFGNMEKKKPPKTPVVNINENKKSEPCVIKKPVQLAYIAIGTTAPGLTDPDAIKLDILADVLGGGISSRFYQNLREEQKLCVSMHCDYISFQQKGLFALFLETKPNLSEKATAAVLEQLKEINVNPINQQELNRAKARIKSDWLHGSETPHGMASTLGTLGTLGQINLIENYLKEVENASVEEINSTFKKYVDNKQFSITRIEPQ